MIKQIEVYFIWYYHTMNFDKFYIMKERKLEGSMGDINIKFLKGGLKTFGLCSQTLSILLFFFLNFSN